MISVEEARTRVLAGLRPTRAEIVPLSAAWGRVTASPVLARVTQPPRDVSAMDGYALRGADPGPWTVVGAAPAGHPWPGHLSSGQALRLFTGSVVPDGADTVALQENAVRRGDHLDFTEPPAPGRHIRARGQDFREGDVLVPAGKRLTPRDVGLAAAGNHPWLHVHRRPRVAIVATGDEVVLPGEAIPDGGIVSSNSHALAALVRAAGGEPMLLPVAADSHESIVEAADSAAGADLLVTTGGASVGDYDLVASALEARGLRLDFWKIAMRPGKPLMHGRLGEGPGAMPLLGLPGNPVSALVCGLLFLRPAIERLSGLPGDPPATTLAMLGAPVAANDERMDFMRARIEPNAAGHLVATPFERQDSGQMRVLAEADGLILRPPRAPAALAGHPCAVIRLDSVGL